MQDKYPLSTKMQAFVEHCESFFPDSIIKQGIAAQRTAYNAMTNSLVNKVPASVDIKDDQIAGVKVRFYSPTTARVNNKTSTADSLDVPPSTTVLYAHGGGWYLGGLESHHNFCVQVALRCKVTVIAVDYRLAPEHPFPAGLNDCFTVYQALLKENVEAVLMGDSAGANLMAALTLKCQQNQIPQARGQVLIYPALAQPNSLPSHHQLSDAPLLSTESVKFCIDSYLAESEQPDRSSELIFPLQATSFEGLPRAAIFAAQYDPLVDDADKYAKKLQQHGVMARSTIINGLVHGALHGIGRSVEADQLLEAICDQLLELSQ